MENRPAFPARKPVEACLSNDGSGLCRLTGKPYCLDTDIFSETCRNAMRRRLLLPRQSEIEEYPSEFPQDLGE